MWNVGFAACSILTLGCIDVRTELFGWAGGTGGGCLGPLGVSLYSSSSSMMRCGSPGLLAPPPLPIWFEPPDNVVLKGSCSLRGG